MTTPDAWWCPRCKAEPSDATFEENCASCGAALTTLADMAEALLSQGYTVVAPGEIGWARGGGDHHEDLTAFRGGEVVAYVWLVRDNGPTHGKWRPWLEDGRRLPVCDTEAEARAAVEAALGTD